MLTGLQKSVHAFLLGKVTKLDWGADGIPSKAVVDSFQVQMPADLRDVSLSFKSLACDGQYLYLFTSRGLFKIGSGYAGTLKGHVYLWKADFYPNDRGTLVFCAVSRRNSRFPKPCRCNFRANCT